MIIPEEDKLLLAIKYDLLEGIFFEDTLYKTMICGIKAVEDSDGEDFILMFKGGTIWHDVRKPYNKTTESIFPLIIKALLEEEISIYCKYERDSDNS